MVLLSLLSFPFLPVVVESLPVPFPPAGVPGVAVGGEKTAGFGGALLVVEVADAGGLVEVELLLSLMEDPLLAALPS